MTTNQQILVLVGVAVGAYWLGKQQALKAAAMPAAQTNIEGAAEWWSYAGTWSM